ncbi:MAG TPA: peptide deformylase [Vicinamibacteria bacterium]
MSILKVARIAHPVLRSPGKPVPKEAFRDRLFQKLVDDMRETMYEYEGVGLAAPQVHEALRLAVIEVPGSDERARAEVPFLVLVNPVVTPLDDERENGWEGCLSIPDLRGVVPRWKRLKLEAQDRDGKAYTLEAQDFFARVVQHECDHLDGNVYLDRMQGMRSLTFIKEFEDHVHKDEEE